MTITIGPHGVGGGVSETVTKESIGLGLVDNTSDLNKPISTAVQNALALKAGSAFSVPGIYTDFLHMINTMPLGLVYNTITSPTNTYVHELNHPGIWAHSSSATAGSGYQVTTNQFSAVNNPIITLHFKTPATISDSLIMHMGTFTGASTHTDRSGIVITGNSAIAANVSASVVTESSSAITLAPDTWYIAKVSYTDTTRFNVKIYNYSGVLLLNYTSTGAIYTNTYCGVKLYSTAAAVTALHKLDYLEVTYGLAPNRPVV